METDISCIKSWALIQYVQARTPDSLPLLWRALEKEYAGDEGPKCFFTNPGNRMSIDSCRIIMELAKKVTSDDMAPLRAAFRFGQPAQFKNSVGLFRSPFGLMKEMLRKSQEADRLSGKKLEFVTFSDTHFIVRVYWPEQVFPCRDFCLFEQGLYQALPKHYGFQPARLWERTCFFKGDPCCEYEIWWDHPRHSKRGSLTFFFGKKENRKKPPERVISRVTSMETANKTDWADTDWPFDTGVSSPDLREKTDCVSPGDAGIPADSEGSDKGVETSLAPPGPIEETSQAPQDSLETIAGEGREETAGPEAAVTTAFEMEADDPPSNLLTPVPENPVHKDAVLAAGAVVAVKADPEPMQETAAMADKDLMPPAAKSFEEETGRGMVISQERGDMGAGPRYDEGGPCCESASSPVGPVEAHHATCRNVLTFPAAIQDGEVEENNTPQDTRESKNDKIIPRVQEISGQFGHLIQGLSRMIALMLSETNAGNPLVEHLKRMDHLLREGDELCTELRSCVGKDRVPSIPSGKIPETAGEDRSQREAAGTGTILLADSMEVYRDMGRDMLGAMGYDAMIASSEPEAIALYRENSDRIAMVVMDMQLSTVGGTLALKEINPSAKILLSHHTNAEEVLKKMKAFGCRGLVQKPFSMTEFYESIQQMVQEEPV